MDPHWYIARLRRMSAAELAGRLRDAAVKLAWRPSQGRTERGCHGATWQARLPAGAAGAVPADAAAATVAAAERILDGGLLVFGKPADGAIGARDWFVDPLTGRRAPDRRYAFLADAADAAGLDDRKHLMEPARLQHVTQLAAAWFVTHRAEFAAAAAAELRSFWRDNPFLCGIHWTSGIEIGLRLVAMAWTRRLLEGWAGAADLFERSPLACGQIHRHLQYVARLRSHGSSANNHLVAELLGLYVGATAFPWFREAPRWARRAKRELERQAAAQTFSDGVNREQAADYHGFTLEMLMVAALEGKIAGDPFSPEFGALLGRMADAWAAMLDRTGCPPRSGDTDDGFALVLDPPDRRTRPGSLLALARTLAVPAGWWPAAAGDLRSAIAERFGPPQRRTPPAVRPNIFVDAGLVVLRDLEERPDELWCRLDHGPQGFLSIMAHAHADALSVELRHGGVDILADPGTYCYRADPDARRYFRSTLAHNTLEIGGVDQAVQAGTFLWAGEARARLLDLEGADSGDVAAWRAEHDGYRRLDGAPVHERRIALDRRARRLIIEDVVRGEGAFAVRLAFHLGPAVTETEDRVLRWSAARRAWSGRLALPPALEWRRFRGSTAPLLGWYSPRFGERVASTTWVGAGTIPPGAVLRTELAIAPADAVRSAMLDEARA